jgi:hypothetical protein
MQFETQAEYEPFIVHMHCYIVKHALLVHIASAHTVQLRCFIDLQYIIMSRFSFLGLALPFYTNNCSTVINPLDRRPGLP